MSGIVAADVISSAFLKPSFSLIKQITIQNKDRKSSIFSNKLSLWGFHCGKD
jgi:hypothetical protein